MCVYIYIYIYMYVCVYVYIYIYIYICVTPLVKACESTCEAEGRARNVAPCKRLDPLRDIRAHRMRSTGTSKLVKPCQLSSVIPQASCAKCSVLLNRRIVIKLYGFPIVAEQ